MAKTPGTDASSARGVGGNIIDNVIRPHSIAAQSNWNPIDPRKVVEIQIVAQAPGDVVIGTGSISAYPHPPTIFLPGPYSAKPPPNTFTPPITFPTMGSWAVPYLDDGPL